MPRKHNHIKPCACPRCGDGAQIVEQRTKYQTLNYFICAVYCADCLNSRFGRLDPDIISLGFSFFSRHRARNKALKKWNRRALNGRKQN